MDLKLKNILKQEWCQTFFHSYKYSQNNCIRAMRLMISKALCSTPSRAGVVVLAFWPVTEECILGRSILVFILIHCSFVLSAVLHLF